MPGVPATASTVPLPIAVNHCLAPADMTVAEFAELAERSGAQGVGWTLDALDRAGPAELTRITRAHGLFVSTLGSAGFFLHSDPDEAAAQHELNLGVLDAAAAIEARCVSITTGGIADGPWSVLGAHARALDALGQLAEIAASRGVQLALEPVHPVEILEVGCVNTIAHALRVLRDIPGLQLLADVYHSAWDPDLLQLPRLAPDRIPVLQVCNWVAPGDSHKPVRDLPATGNTDVGQLLRRWRGSGWTGVVEFELLDQHRRGRSVNALLSSAVAQLQGLMAG